MKYDFASCTLCGKEGYTLRVHCPDSHTGCPMTKAPDKGIVLGQAEPDAPAHYTAGEVECIDAIRAAMTLEQFRGYLRGNAFKYLWRYEHKGGMSDLTKGIDYFNRLRDTYLKSS